MVSVIRPNREAWELKAAASVIFRVSYPNRGRQKPRQVAQQGRFPHPPAAVEDGAGQPVASMSWHSS